MQRVHISDTIATHDTTVERLALQYRLLSDTLGYIDSQVHFLASEFGNSIHTGHLALQYITQHEDNVKNGSIANTICVNNASRAKHKDSGNAKGSGCLRAKVQLTTDSPIRNIVGVDDEVFEIFMPYILDLQLVECITLGSKTVNDISQGSQFRSLEYRPTAQVLIHTYQDDVEKLDQHIQTLPYTLTHTATQDHKNIDLTDISEKRIVLEHTYESQEDRLLQKTQLIGQFDKYFVDRGCPISEKMSIYREKLLEKYGNNLYEETQKSLGSNTLRVIDKDKFGNIKCMSTRQKGVVDIAQHLSVNLGEQLYIQRNTSEGEIIKDTVYIVRSLSDKTGAKCLRNGSSRGPQGQRCVELNISKDSSYRSWEELDTLYIGSIITLSTTQL